MSRNRKPSLLDLAPQETTDAESAQLRGGETSEGSVFEMLQSAVSSALRSIGESLTQIARKG